MPVGVPTGEGGAREIQVFFRLCGIKLKNYYYCGSATDMIFKITELCTLLPQLYVFSLTTVALPQWSLMFNLRAMVLGFNLIFVVSIS